MSVRGYRKLETSNDPNCFWMARVESGAQTEPRLNRLAPFEISFDCKPQKFLKSGLSSIKTANGGKIYNEYGFETQPLLKIEAKAGNPSERTGVGTVTIGKKTISIKTHTWSYGSLMREVETIGKDYDLTLGVLIENLDKIGVSVDAFAGVLDAMDSVMEDPLFANWVPGFADLILNNSNSGTSIDDVWAALVMPEYFWGQVWSNLHHGSASSSMWIDSETMEAYDELCDQNRNVNAPEFLTLLPGENKISWSGDVVGIDLVPRWWCL